MPASSVFVKHMLCLPLYNYPPHRIAKRVFRECGQRGRHLCWRRDVIVIPVSIPAFVHQDPSNPPLRSRFAILELRLECMLCRLKRKRRGMVEELRVLNNLALLEYLMPHSFSAMSRLELCPNPIGTSLDIETKRLQPSSNLWLSVYDGFGTLARVSREPCVLRIYLCLRH